MSSSHASFFGGAVAYGLEGIPILMFSWGLVTLAHALIENKAGYLTGKLTNLFLGSNMYLIFFLLLSSGL